MKRDAMVGAQRPALVPLLLLVLASTTLPLHGQPTPPAPEDRAVMAGTVRAVDAKARTLEVLTGVGHAFRLVSVRASRDCEITDAGKAVSLDTIRHGRVVRVEYLIGVPAREAAAPRAAVSIEVLSIDELRGAR